MSSEPKRRRRRRRNAESAGQTRADDAQDVDAALYSSGQRRRRTAAAAAAASDDRGSEAAAAAAAPAPEDGEESAVARREEAATAEVADEEEEKEEESAETSRDETSTSDDAAPGELQRSTVSFTLSGLDAPGPKPAPAPVDPMGMDLSAIDLGKYDLDELAAALQRQAEVVEAARKRRDQAEADASRPETLAATVEAAEERMRRERSEFQRLHAAIQERKARKARVEEERMRIVQEMHALERERQLEALALAQLRADEVRRAVEEKEKAVERAAWQLQAIRTEKKEQDGEHAAILRDLLERAEGMQSVLDIAAFTDDELAAHARDILYDGKHTLHQDLQQRLRRHRDELAYTRMERVRAMNRKRRVLDRRLRELSEQMRNVRVLKKHALGDLVQAELAGRPVELAPELLESVPVQAPSVVPDVRRFVESCRARIPHLENRVDRLQAELDVYRRLVANGRPQPGMPDPDPPTSKPSHALRRIVLFMVDSAVDFVEWKAEHLRPPDVVQAMESRYHDQLEKIQYANERRMTEAGERAAMNDILSEVIREMAEDVYDEHARCWNLADELLTGALGKTLDATRREHVPVDTLYPLLGEMMRRKADVGSAFGQRARDVGGGMTELPPPLTWVESSELDELYFEGVDFRQTQARIPEGIVTCSRPSEDGSYVAVGTSVGGMYIYRLAGAQYVTAESVEGPLSGDDEDGAGGAGEEQAMSKKEARRRAKAARRAARRSVLLLRAIRRMPYNLGAPIRMVQWSMDNMQFVTLDMRGTVRSWSTLSDFSNPRANELSREGKYQPPANSQIVAIPWPRGLLVDRLHDIEKVDTVLKPARAARAAKDINEAMLPAIQSIVFPTRIAVVPSFTLFGTSPSLLIGLRNGDVMRCTIEALASRTLPAGMPPVRGNVGRYVTQVPTQLDPSDDSRISLVREAFRGHSSRIVTVGHVLFDPLRPVTFDARGVVNWWQGDDAHLLQIGWFEPAQTLRLPTRVASFVGQPDQVPVTVFPPRRLKVPKRGGVPSAKYLAFRAEADVHIESLLQSSLYPQPWRVIESTDGSRDIYYMPTVLGAQRSHFHHVARSPRDELVRHEIIEFVDGTTVTGIVDGQLNPTATQLVIMLHSADPEGVGEVLSFLWVDLVRSRLRRWRVDVRASGNEDPCFAVSPVIAETTSDYVYLYMNRAVHVLSSKTGAFCQSARVDVRLPKSAIVRSLTVTNTHRHVLVTTDKEIIVLAVLPDPAPMSPRMVALRRVQYVPDAPPMRAMVTHRAPLWRGGRTINVARMVGNMIDTLIGVVVDPSRRPGLWDFWAKSRAVRDSWPGKAAARAARAGPGNWGVRPPDGGVGDPIVVDRLFWLRNTPATWRVFDLSKPFLLTDTDVMPDEEALRAEEVAVRAEQAALEAAAAGRSDDEDEDEEEGEEDAEEDAEEEDAEEEDAEEEDADDDEEFQASE